MLKLMQQPKFTGHPLMKAIVARVSNQGYTDIGAFVDHFTRWMEQNIPDCTVDDSVSLINSNKSYWYYDTVLINSTVLSIYLYDVPGMIIPILESSAV